jgi:signal peptidase I
LKLAQNNSGFSATKEEISFSGASLAELLCATLAKGVPFRFKVKGFSMTPFIRDGDIVTISSLTEAGLSFGRPVAFINPETRTLAIHRVVGMSGIRYLIKGDNALEPDGVISKDNILGYVTRVQRNGRNIFAGLGPERYIVALLSRRTLIFPFLLSVYKRLRGIKRQK